MRGHGEARSLGDVLRGVGLVALVVVAAVVAYLAVTRDTDPPSPPGATSTEGAEPSASESSDPDAPPEVADQVRVDFATTTALPEGFATADAGAVGGPLVVQRGLLTHDRPQGKRATGTAETQLAGDVQKLGAVVSFPRGNAGSAFLVAWTDSLVAASDAGEPEPTSGLRLEVAYGLWQLSVYDDGEESVVAGDEYEPADGALQQFEVVRRDDLAWVTDPAGVVTAVQQPAIAALAGPWASWQVAEAGPGERPVGLQSIWAG